MNALITAVFLLLIAWLGLYIYENSNYYCPIKEKQVYCPIYVKTGSVMIPINNWCSVCPVPKVKRI